MVAARGNAALMALCSITVDDKYCQPQHRYEIRLRCVRPAAESERPHIGQGMCVGVTNDHHIAFNNAVQCLSERWNKRDDAV